MRWPEQSFSIRFDAANPGQFLACCGLLELAARANRGAEGWFEGDVFRCACGGLSPASIAQLVLDGEVARNGEWHEDKMAPLLLEPMGLALDWWIGSKGRKTPFKLWSGNQGSLQILRKLVASCRRLNAADSLFDAAEPLTGRLGVDPRSAWTALDVGFSPNKNGDKVDTFSIVEMLAFIGLERFRPVPDESGGWLYHLWDFPLEPVPAAAAAAGFVPGSRKYRFVLSKRGGCKGFQYAREM